jgi:hypothetical protein
MMIRPPRPGGIKVLLLRIHLVCQHNRRRAVLRRRHPPDAVGGVPRWRSAAKTAAPVLYRAGKSSRIHAQLRADSRGPSASGTRKFPTTPRGSVFCPAGPAGPKVLAGHMGPVHQDHTILNLVVFWPTCPITSVQNARGMYVRPRHKKGT